jgi:hypothetical protein
VSLQRGKGEDVDYHPGVKFRSVDLGSGRKDNRHDEIRDSHTSGYLPNKNDS